MECELRRKLRIQLGWSNRRPVQNCVESTLDVHAGVRGQFAMKQLFEGDVFAGEEDASEPVRIGQT